MKNNFEDEFDSLKDIESAYSDVVKFAAADILNQESRTAVLNLRKMAEIQFTYKVLKFLSKNMDVKLSYKLHEPFQSMGSVSLLGKNICFTDSVWFIKACQFASNIEVYKQTTGDVKMTFTFHNLVMPVE